jgi:hypothetical protein
VPSRAEDAGNGPIGFGKAAPGASYPATNDDQHQYGWIGQTITGDPDVFGRACPGTNGRGVLYADPVGGR